MTESILELVHFAHVKEADEPLSMPGGMERQPPPHGPGQRDILSTTNFDYPNSTQSTAPGQFDDFTAAQVLASFNQYPIRASARQPPPGRPSYQAQAQQEGEHYDPLWADIQAAGRELPHALYPILHRTSNRPINRDDPPFDLDNCRGVVEIGGAMVPGGTNQRNLDHHLEYATPAASPTYVPTVERGFRPEASGSGAGATSAPDSEQQFKTTFQFVGNESAKEARNTVRKHVMREYRRRERWEQGKRGPSEPKVQRTGTGQKRRRRVEKSSREELEVGTREEILVSPPGSEAGERSESSGKSEGCNDRVDSRTEKETALRSAQFAGKQTTPTLGCDIFGIRQCYRGNGTEQVTPL